MIDQLQAAALQPLVKNFQQQVLKELPVLSCELMQRPAASPEGQRTWMGTGRHANDQMIDGIARLARDMQLPAGRVSEIFVPLQ